MAFSIPCPNCGGRSSHEFRFGGEVNPRPAPDAPSDEWSGYFYSRRNLVGPQREWWNHTFGCRKWFVAVRDTVSNEVSQTFWAEQSPG